MGLGGLIISGVLAYLYTAKYSFLELTPSNYHYILKESHQKSIFCCGTTSFLENPIFIEDAAHIQSSPQYQYNKFKGANDHQVIEIINQDNHVMYQVVYDKTNPQLAISYSVMEWPPFEEYRGTIKKYLRLLLEKGEFSLKRTELINVTDDVIIKDIGDYFIAGLVIGKADNPGAIKFQVFKKRKYFKNYFE